MLTDTIATAAALRSRSESPFVLSTGAPTSWQFAVPNPADTTGVTAIAHRLRSQDPKLTTVNTGPMAGAGARVATKQDRPPRGVPR